MNDNPLNVIAPSPTHSQIEAFADACTLLARVSSILDNIYDNRHLLSVAVYSYLETTYFLVIFLCQCLIDQLSEWITHPLKTLFISIFTYWLKFITGQLIHNYRFLELATLLHITYVFTFPSQDLIDLFRNAESATCSLDFPPVLHSSPSTF